MSGATTLEQIAATIRPDPAEVPHWLSDEYFDKQARLIHAMRMSLELTRAQNQLERQFRPRRPSLLSQWRKLVRWSSKPSKGKSQVIPGLSLDMTVLGLFVVIGIANLIA